MERFILALVIAGTLTLVWGQVPTPCDMSEACYDDGEAIKHTGYFTKLSQTTNDPEVWVFGVNRTVVNEACAVWANTLGCVSPHIGSCNDSVQNFAHDTLNRYTYLYCNRDFRCKAHYFECFQQDRELYEYLESLDDIDTTDEGIDVAFCPHMATLMSCLDEIDPYCLNLEPTSAVFIPQVRPVFDYCQEAQCAPLTSCQLAFLAGGPAEDGMDANTCRLYASYTGCAEDMVRRCPQIQRPRHQPPISVITSALEGACDAMDMYSTIYECAAFDTCVDQTIEVVNFLSPVMFCHIAQGVMGCAAKSAMACSLNQTVVHSFNHLMLDAAGHGCMPPAIDADDCTALSDCSMPLDEVLMNPNRTFMDQCLAVHTFLPCAMSAAEECHLQVPPNEHVEHYPSMTDIHHMIEHVCVGLNGTGLSQCGYYLECMSGYDNQVKTVPKYAGERLTSISWCRQLSQVVGCAHYVEEGCPISPEEQTVLDDLAIMMRDHGCPDLFMSYPATAAPPATTDGDTGGVERRTALSVVSLVMLTLLSLVLA